MKKRIITIALMTVFSLSVLFGYGSTIKEETVTVEDYVPVEVEEVGVHTLSEKISFSGEIIPSSTVNIVPKMPGKVESVNVEVGAMVSQGSVLFTMDNRELQGQVNQAKKALELAKANYDNVKKQLGKKSSPDLDMLKIQVDQADISYNQAQEALNSANVTSPINGVVSELNIHQGEMASNAQVSAVVIDNTKMYVKIDIPENIISKLAVGDKAITSIPSADFNNEGLVEMISPTVDARTQLYFLKVLITDIPETVRAGMFAKVVLDINPKENIVAVESDSLIEEGTKTYVFLEQDELAEKREVVTGIDSGEYTEIVSGLKIGDTVLVKGQNFVEDGTKVKVIRGES